MNNLQLITEAIKGITKDLRIDRAREDLSRLKHLRNSFDAFSDYEIAQLFRIPMCKRNEALIAIDRDIAAKQRHIEWLETFTEMEVPDSVNKAWMRDLNTIANSGGNTD